MPVFLKVLVTTARIKKARIVYLYPELGIGLENRIEIEEHLKS